VCVCVIFYMADLVRTPFFGTSFLSIYKQTLQDLQGLCPEVIQHYIYPILLVKASQRTSPNLKRRTIDFTVDENSHPLTFTKAW
jgi:hypothetical protein